MNTPAARLKLVIEAAGYTFTKCNATTYWVCSDDTDLSEVAAGLQLGPLIYKVAELLGV